MELFRRTMEERAVRIRISMQKATEIFQKWAVHRLPQLFFIAYRTNSK